MPLTGLARGAAALAAALALAACATEPPRPLRLPQTGRVALVAARFEPQTNFNAYAQGKGAAAGKLGAGGAAGGAAAGALVPLTDPVGVALYPYIAPFTILAGALLGGAAGGVQGARYGLEAKDAEAVRRTVDEAFAALKVQDAIATRVAEAMAARGRPLERAESATAPDAPYAAVIETALTSVRFVAKKGEPPRLAMEMALRVRVLEGSGASERGFAYKSRPEPIARWAGNGGALIRAELEAGYRELAEDVAAVLMER